MARAVQINQGCSVEIFAEPGLREYLDGVLAAAEGKVYKEDKNRLLNVNETEYIQYLSQEHRVEPITFLWDRIMISDREEMIPAEMFPRTFNVYRGKSYRKQVITYHLPFTGTFKLLSLRPSYFLHWTTEVTAKPPATTGVGSVSFDVINWRDNTEEIKRVADDILEHLRRQASSSAEEVERFNSGLEEKIAQIVQGRKKQILRESNLLGSLGVPIQTSESSVPATFAIPIQKKTIQIKKPESSNELFVPEPTLDQGTYKAILSACQATGIEMERHPSIYKDKPEETLRDHFIMVLAPHFHSVTGETFNRTGKTDILIRHDGKNVFVAECKYWKGAKAHLNTIDQILSYLTWRDSKSAILLFVRNKNLSPVLQEIEQSTPSHPCYVKFRGQTSPGWFDYHFHLAHDSTRGVELSILCFHFPD